jgi:hypothetical protein
VRLAAIPFSFFTFHFVLTGQNHPAAWMDAAADALDLFPLRAQPPGKFPVVRPVRGD